MCLVVINIDNKCDRMCKHTGGKPLGMSVVESLDRVSQDRKSYSKLEGTIPQLGPGLHKSNLTTKFIFF